MKPLGIFALLALPFATFAAAYEVAAAHVRCSPAHQWPLLLERLAAPTVMAGLRWLPWLTAGMVLLFPLVILVCIILQRRSAGRLHIIFWALLGMGLWFAATAVPRSTADNPTAWPFVLGWLGVASQSVAVALAFRLQQVRQRAHRSRLPAWLLVLVAVATMFLWVALAALVALIPLLLGLREEAGVAR